jgi:fluoride exporter
MRNALWVGAGSALGGATRYGLTALSLWLAGPPFPWGTLAANVLGALLLGVLAGVFRVGGRFHLPGEAHLFLTAGFCGGLTTFSFLSWQALLLAGRGDWAAAGGYLGATAVLGLGAVWAGYAAGARLSAGRA